HDVARRQVSIAQRVQIGKWRGIDALNAKAHAISYMSEHRPSASHALAGFGPAAGKTCMRLNQVTASATDLEASIAFYKLLGLKLIVESPHYARFELPDGEATFSLHIADGDVPLERAPQIYFECDDVDGEVRRLSAAGVRFDRAPTMQTWLWYEAW